jgi:CII-binding regulator of phage lambda lysogenization HflD
VLDFIKSLARSLVDRDVEKEEKRLEEELNKKILDYDWRRLQFDKQEQKYQVQIHTLELELSSAKRLIKELGSDLEVCERSRDTFRRDSDRLDEIRNVLREILNL